jgi:hypothetical protein
MADGARKIALENCAIEHIGTYAIWFRHACSECRVVHCLLQDLGAGGVRSQHLPGLARLGRTELVGVLCRTMERTFLALFTRSFIPCSRCVLPMPLFA